MINTYQEFIEVYENEILSAFDDLVIELMTCDRMYLGEIKEYLEDSHSIYLNFNDIIFYLNSHSEIFYYKDHHFAVYFPF